MQLPEATLMPVCAGVGTTRDTLIITRIAPSEAPKLDGVLDDAAWAKARPVYVQPEREGDWRERHVRAREWRDRQDHHDHHDDHHDRGEHRGHDD